MESYRTIFSTRTPTLSYMNAIWESRECRTRSMDPSPRRTINMIVNGRGSILTILSTRTSSVHTSKYTTLT